MAVLVSLTNARSTRPAREGISQDTMAQPAPVRELRPVAPPRPPAPHADGRRPARLAGAPFRTVLRSCATRPVAGSVGWLVLAAALTFVVVLGIGWLAGGQADASVPTRTVLVQVQPGDTLWSVAQRSAPAAATAATVDRIRELNGLSTQEALYPGELLKVPANS